MMEENEHNDESNFKKSFTLDIRIPQSYLYCYQNKKTSWFYKTMYKPDVFAHNNIVTNQWFKNFRKDITDFMEKKMSYNEECLYTILQFIIEYVGSYNKIQKDRTIAKKKELKYDMKKKRKKSTDIL